MKSLNRLQKGIGHKNNKFQRNVCCMQLIKLSSYIQFLTISSDLIIKTLTFYQFQLNLLLLKELYFLLFDIPKINL